MASHWLKDNTGKRFGNMVVLKDSGIRQNRKVVWICQCDCGQIFNARSDRINNGTTISCPECAQKRNIEHLLEVNGTPRKVFNPGEKYGKLTLLEQLDKKDSIGCFYWKCQCECGNITEISTAHIGKTQSCGCIKGEPPKDITGQRFGKLVALYRDGKHEKSHVSYWVCQCDCGRWTKVILTNLTAGHTQSCGMCLNSKGELKIYQILKDNKINFEEQKTFETCKFPNTNHPARFDFYLPDYNLLIEFDGKQHFEYNKNNNSFWNNKEEFEKCQYRDVYKTQWTEENNIKLKRIPYWDYDKITLEYLLS